MKPRRLLETLILVLGAFLVIQGFLMHVVSPGARGDLDILLTAGTRFSQGLPIYRLEDFAEHTKPPLLTPILVLLSKLPREVVRVAWDLMNLFLPLLVMIQWCRLRVSSFSIRDRGFWIYAAGSFILLRGAWRAEMDFGQYNLLMLALTLGSALGVAKGRPIQAGALATISILGKPTQLFFLPWIFSNLSRPPKSRELLHFIAGILGCILVLATLDSLFRQSGSPWLDQIQWFKFISESSQKHLFREDNWGLPSLMARLGSTGSLSSALLAMGLLIACISSWVWKKAPDRSVHLIAWLSLALSPMTWNQNFVILFPLAFVVMGAAFERETRAWAIAAALALFIPSAIKPALYGEAFHRLWTTVSIPLLVTGFAVLITTTVLRPPGEEP